MTAFHEGQEVEVAEIRGVPRQFRVWRKGKIIPPLPTITQRYRVQFPDGRRAVFDAEYIRQVSP